MNKERLMGFAQAFMAGLLWGGTSPIAQYLFEEKGIVSSWLVPYRLLSAGILLLVYALFKKKTAKEMWKDGKDVTRLVAFSIFGMMGMQFSFFSAVEEMNAGTATIFQYLNPAMLIFYFAIVYRIRPKAKELIAVACSLVGIFLVATHGNVHELTVSPMGIVYGLILAVATCCCGVLPAPLLKKYPAETVNAWAMIIGGIVLTIFTRPWQYDVTIDAAVVIGFFSISILGTILPFCYYMAAIKRIGSVYSGLLSAVEPVAATVLAAIFLGTKFETIDVIGFAFVLSTLFILNIDT